MELEDILKQPLRQYPIQANVPGPLLRQLWGGALSDDYEDDDATNMSQYWEFYSKRSCRYFLGPARQLFLDAHADVVPVFREVLSDSSRDKIRDDILHLARDKGPANTTNTTTTDIAVAAAAADPPVTALDVDGAIDLCASLATMTEIGLGEERSGLSGRPTIEWTEGSLRQALAGYFVPQTKLDHGGNSKLSRLFTARNLSRISGIKIKWTTSLTNHLRLVDDDQAVYIFHSVSFLQFQERLGHNIFPESFVKETLNTLALLFPAADKDTKQWLQAQRKKTQSPSQVISQTATKIDGQLGRCGTLRTDGRRLESFSFWHDRLVILKQAFDESQPRDLSQWWFDRRNGVQWYTFWVAILLFVLALFFGVAQCVESALQVVVAYRSLALQEAQQ